MRIRLYSRKFFLDNCFDWFSDLKYRKMISLIFTVSGMNKVSCMYLYLVPVLSLSIVEGHLKMR